MNVVLHERTACHVRHYFEKTRDPEIQRWLPQRAQTVDDALADFRLSIAPGSTSYGRTIYADGEYVGDIWCYCIHEEPDPDAMVSYCIFEKARWNQGIATCALALFLEEVARKFSLTHIGAFTYADNIPSIRVLENNGFIKQEIFEENGLLSVYLQLNLT